MVKLLTIDRLKKDLTSAMSDTVSKATIERPYWNYNTDNSAYTDHIYSERHYFVEKRSRGRDRIKGFR